MTVHQVRAERENWKHYRTSMISSRADFFFFSLASEVEGASFLFPDPAAFRALGPRATLRGRGRHSVNQSEIPTVIYFCIAIDDGESFLLRSRLLYLALDRPSAEEQEPLARLKVTEI